MKNLLTILTIFLVIIFSLTITDSKMQNTQTENIRVEQKIEEKQEIKDSEEKDDTTPFILILYVSLFFASLNMLIITAVNSVEQDVEKKELQKFVKKNRFN